MIRKGLLFAALAIILFLAFRHFFVEKTASTSRDKKEMKTYTDLAGRKVSITKNVNRIVLLRSKDIYTVAVLLGDELPKKMIAWGPDLKNDDTEAYEKFTSKYPALKTLPLTGSIYNDALSVEQLLQLHPISLSPTGLFSTEDTGM